MNEHYSVNKIYTLKITEKKDGKSDSFHTYDVHQ